MNLNLGNNFTGSGGGKQKPLTPEEKQAKANERAALISTNPKQWMADHIKDFYKAAQSNKTEMEEFDKEVQQFLTNSEIAAAQGDDSDGPTNNHISFYV